MTLIHDKIDWLTSLKRLSFPDENIQVSIKGDLNQAKVEFYTNQQKKNSGNGGLEDQDEDIGNDVDEDEEKGIMLERWWKVHSV